LIDLPPTIKFHLLEDHLVDYLGNGERLEESTEQQHQISHSFEVRSRIADFIKKRRVFGRQEAVRNNEGVQKEMERVLKGTARAKRAELSQLRMEDETKKRRTRAL
jgi:hypothetical protein